MEVILMTKAEAIQAFFESFGLRAYEEHSVPVYLDDAQTTENTPPYITYQLATDDFRGGTVAITADVWDCSESWEFVNETAAAIAGDIGSFKRLSCDDGYIIVTKGSPFSQSYADDIYKRAYMNLNLTFITTK